MTKTVFAILTNSLVAALTNTFVWFAVTFRFFLHTQSVLATSVMAGVYVGTVALSSFFLGSLRGIALLFTLTELIGLMVTLLAMRSHAYRDYLRTIKKIPAPSLQFKNYPCNELTPCHLR